MRPRFVPAAVALVVAAFHFTVLSQPSPPTVKVSAFNPPSLGSYIPPIIKARGLHRANGSAPPATPSQLADLRTQVRGPMAAVKQAVVRWRDAEALGPESGNP